MRKKIISSIIIIITVLLTAVIFITMIYADDASEYTFVYNGNTATIRNGELVDLKDANGNTVPKKADWFPSIVVNGLNLMSEEEIKTHWVGTIFDGGGGTTLVNANSKGNSFNRSMFSTYA